MELGTVTVRSDRVNGFNANTVEAGTFRGASILDVPATVNTAMRDVMELQGATGIHDVLRNTAGVTRQQNAGDTFDQLVIRGITVENRTNYRLSGSLAVPNVSEIPLRAGAVPVATLAWPSTTTARRRPSPTWAAGSVTATGSACASTWPADSSAPPSVAWTATAGSSPAPSTGASTAGSRCARTSRPTARASWSRPASRGWRRSTA